MGVFGVLAAAALVAASQTLASSDPGTGPDWATYGYDPANTRDQPFEHDISTANVSQLSVRWAAATSGDVSATPAVVGGYVYFGDFGGSIWKLSAATGAVIWHQSVPSITGIAGDYARTSPAVDVNGNVVILGTNKQPFLIGLSTTDGSLLWKTQVNPDLRGTMTGSPQLVGDTVVTGVSAAGASAFPSTFRGDIAAVNALTGALEWQTFSLPTYTNNGIGYAGGTMFSAPAVDVADNLVFGTFGNLYQEPPDVTACNQSQPNGFFSEACEQPGNFFDSIVAFDLTTGQPVWHYRIVGDAPWHSVCDAQPVSWCLPEDDTPVAPAGAPGRGFGDDWDVGGSSPNVFTLNGREVVGFGVKAGVYYLFDAATGRLLWNTLVGAGGDQGGFEWGTAVEGNRILVSLTDQHHLPYQLTENGVLTSQTTTGGSWAALDASTGKILWQTADPQTETLAAPTGTVGVWDLGPATVANGVDYVASMAKSGAEMYALDAATGSILWSYAAGSSVNAGPAIVDGSVYWGAGYSKSAEGSGNNKLYAFSVGGVFDTTAPTTTITLSPSTPNGANGWYRTAVGVTVGATDNQGGVGVFGTRCVLDPATAPASFDDLPAGDCTLASVGADGKHTIYAAGVDRDNNEGAVASTTVMLDATPPTITAAATTPPNANGWYSGPVTVRFTCTDATSGIPPGACPSDQTLSGIGTAVSSTPETVLDAAGNPSTPSNVVTVKIVNPAGLCATTRDDVESSTKYRDSRPPQREAAEAQLRTACDLVTVVGPKRTPVQPRIFGNAYAELVTSLERQEFLTQAQAASLDALAAGL